MNSGVAFDLFPGISIYIIFFILIGLIIYAVKVRELWERVGIGMIIIGGAGNIYLRAVYGGVVDNLNFLGILYNNVWDYLIFAGVVIYGYYSYLRG